jgi:hypothetical protein
VNPKGDRISALRLRHTIRGGRGDGGRWLRRSRLSLPLLARPLILDVDDNPISSGYTCFRAFLQPTQEKREDKALNKYLGQDCVNLWISSDTHVAQNTMRGGNEFNWILMHKGNSHVPESWLQPGDIDEHSRRYTMLY